MNINAKFLSLMVCEKLTQTIRGRILALIFILPNGMYMYRYQNQGMEDGEGTSLPVGLVFSSTCFVQ